MKKHIQKLMLAGLLVISTIALSACTTQETEEKDNTKEEIITSTTNTTASSENESTAPEEVAVEITADFNEAFEIKPNEKLYIGNENTSIEIQYLQYYDSGLTDAAYVMTIDDIMYDGYASWYAPESSGSYQQSKYSPNQIVVVDANTDQSITLKITEPLETPEPLTLSGNPEDVYVTTKQEYVISDDIILFLCEGTTLYGDTMELIHTIKDLVEKETGMQLDAAVPNAECFITGEIATHYGQNAFPGVDPDNTKFHIYIVPFEVASPYASRGSITLNPLDLEIATGEGFAFVHEMTHCVQMANGRLISTTMNEGFATYITGQIADRDEIIPFNFNSEYNYSHYNNNITTQNAESIFIEETGVPDDKYCLGYRFVSFLFDKYGEDIYKNILNDASNEFDLSVNITEEAMIPIIKRNTSDDVFSQFAEWLNLNKERFDGQ